jgi:D-xylose reductase
VSGSLFTPYGHHIKLRKTLFHSNYNGALLLDLQRYARIEPAVLQIEHHPYLVQQPLLDLVKTLGIAVTAYSSYGPQTWRELDMHQKVPSLFENDAITTIAKRHGRVRLWFRLLIDLLTYISSAPANVLLRWATQRGLAVIPKSNSLARVKENFHATGFVLTEEEIKQISSLDQGLRFNDPASIDIGLSIWA